MAKQQKSHKLIFKLHSSRLVKCNWDLKLSLKEARKNKNDVVALSDSQVLRFLDDINNNHDYDKKVKELKEQIKLLNKEQVSKETKKKIRECYDEMYETQFQSDFVCIIMDSEDDFDRANMGFKINGIDYVILLGTNGGIKKSTIIYVNKEKYNELNTRIQNGRNKNKLVPAKLGAYMALSCSGSIVVTQPNGVIVVNDCETMFNEDVIYLTDVKEGSNKFEKEPKKEVKKNYECKLVDSDGYGFMSPSYSRVLNNDLYGDDKHTISGVNTRWSWDKGMAYTFDYVEFADVVVRKERNLPKDDESVYMITDVWGDIRDVRKADLILTESMLKLWDSYDSLEDYLFNCKKNNFQFSIAKTTPHKLENVRYSNYQFIQNYDFSDEDLLELCKPTMDEINDILGMDYKKSILYLNGIGLNENNVDYIDNNFIKALMIDESMINDPFVRSKIHNMIKKKIDEAKISKLKLNGNFQIISGDLYSLAQSMFGLNVTGLLKKGEVYSKYWSDLNQNEIIVMRAPMSNKYNIRKLNVKAEKEMKHWYKYVKTAMILNSWDTTCDALNGADKDSDTFFSTNNNVLLRNTKNLPSIQCIQRRAEKKTCTQKQMIRAYKLGFGDEVGTTTNHITSMIEKQAEFEVGSEEWNVLEYRIMCGQLYQQNSIDKCKGIIAKPMPKSWYKLKCCKDDDVSIVEFNKRICAYKKPYFMRYIYPQSNNDLKKYIDNNNKNCMRQFRMRLDDLLKIKDITVKQKEFIDNYNRYMPLGNNNCTINKICWLFEEEFDGFKPKDTQLKFDYSILRNDKYEYKKSTYSKIECIYKEYMKKLSDFMVKAKDEKIDKDDVVVNKEQFKLDFKAECQSECPNVYELCNIVVDMCYKTNKSKQFAWDICGDIIIENLLNRNNNIIQYIQRDDNGDIEYNGNMFILKTKTINIDDLQEEF